MNKGKFLYYKILITIIMCLCLFTSCCKTEKSTDVQEQKETQVRQAYGYYEIVDTWKSNDYEQVLVRDPYSDVLYIISREYQRVAITALYDENRDLLTYDTYKKDESHPLHFIVKNRKGEK